MKKTVIIITALFGAILFISLFLNFVANLEMETEVVIPAPKEQVWNVLPDNYKYAG